VFAKITSVYDGDSCKANVFVGDVLYQFTIRVNGYDSPEIRTKNSNEKLCAVKSKEALSFLICNKVVRLQCLENDKYGRVLADIFVLKLGGLDSDLKELHVNDFMVQNHLGHPYFGDKKTGFDSLLENKYYSLGNSHCDKLSLYIILFTSLYV
jgi:endonuclease YncB( thermonuclease family)